MKVPIIVLTLLFSTCVFSQSIFLRGGYSSVMGFGGVEYIDPGNFPLAFQVGFAKTTTKNFKETKPNIGIALNRYFKNSQKSGFYIFIAMMINGLYEERGSRNSFDVNWYHVGSIGGGYRIALSNFDIKLGGGYSKGEKTNISGYALDFSVGINISEILLRTD